MATIFTSEAELTAGKWYAIGFKQKEGEEINWSAAMIYKYEGNGIWSNEEGEEVEDTLDPALQLRVPCGAADAFAVQS